MTEQEKINERFDNRISSIELQVTTVAAKVDMVIEEIRQQREDLRRIQERQDEERRKHDADIKAAQAKHDADIKEMNQRFYAKFDAMDKKIDDKFDKFSSQLQMMSVTTILGVGAIVWAIVSALK